MPRVSVLLPVRDAERTLAQAIESVLRQTFTDLECVIVDDGSTDGSRAIAQTFSVRDPRVRIIDHAHAAGGNPLVAALNAGIDATRGEWIARMDADDVMRSTRLASQLAAGHDACGSHVRVFPRSAMTEGAREYERWLASFTTLATLARDAFVECPIAHPTLFVRRTLLAELRYRDGGWPEDYDLMLRLLERGASIGVVPLRLLSWRDGARRHSRTHPAYSLEAFAACKAHFLARGFLAHHETFVLIGYGSTGKMLRAALDRESRHPSLIVDLHPGRIGQLIDGVRVAGPEALASIRAPILASVSGEQPRAALRGELARSGFVEGRDFVSCA